MLAKVQNPVLIHYGSYETTFFKRMCDRYGFPPEQSSAVRALKTSVNPLSVIFAKIYFPTFSNGLKDIGHFLVVTWDSPVRSGLQSLAVRLDWDQDQFVSTTCAGQLVRKTYGECDRRIARLSREISLIDCVSVPVRVNMVPSVEAVRHCAAIVFEGR